MEKIRQIIFHKDYFLDFYNNQTEKVKDKIEHVLYVISVAERIPIDHYIRTLGAYHFGGHLMVISTDPAQILVDKYFKE